MSLIKFVATQGRATRPDGCCNKWVESYTLEISKDCNTFNFLQDENGQIIVSRFLPYFLDKNENFSGEINMKTLFT